MYFTAKMIELVFVLLMFVYGVSSQSGPLPDGEHFGVKSQFSPFLGGEDFGIKSQLSSFLGGEDFGVGSHFRPPFLDGEELPSVAKMKIDHHLQYLRYMDTERLTCHYAVAVSEGLLHTIKKDLEILMTGTVKHINLMLLCVDALGAKRCIETYSSFPYEAVEEELQTFSQCLRPAIQRQYQLNETFSATYDRYQRGYDAAMKKIDACQYHYPNMHEKTKREVCIKTVYNTYLTKTTRISKDQIQSPCMRAFVTNVIGCAETSAANIHAKTEKYRSLVSNCAKIDVESKDCAETNGNTISLQPNIATQIQEAQLMLANATGRFESTIGELHTLYTEVFESVKYLPHSYFGDSLNKLIDPYLKAVKQGIEENRRPMEEACGSYAENFLRYVTKQGAKDYNECYRSAAMWRRWGLQGISVRYREIALTLEGRGNVYILNCISQGLYFGLNAIKECFHFNFRHLETESLAELDELAKRMEEIKSEDLPFFDRPSTLPCAVKNFWEIQLEADYALFEYKKCLYIESGTEYSVTTPQTSTLFSFITDDLSATTPTDLFDGDETGSTDEWYLA